MKPVSGELSGSAEIMHERLLHLVELGRAPHITIQVLPFTAGNNTVRQGVVVTPNSHPHLVDPALGLAESRGEHLLEPSCKALRQ